MVLEKGKIKVNLLFHTFSVLVANPKNLLYTVANPARGLLNRGKKKEEKSLAAHPSFKKKRQILPPPTLLVHATHLHV